MVAMFLASEATLFLALRFQMVPSCLGAGKPSLWKVMLGKGEALLEVPSQTQDSGKWF